MKSVRLLIGIVSVLMLTTSVFAMDMAMVYVNEPNFVGWMGKYEVTNEQYCDFLNEALASGDVTVNGGIVYGANGSNAGEDFVGQVYFETYQADSDSQISYDGNSFSVRSRDGYSMGGHPAIEVSWYGALAFCNYYGYRLPTEWEWQAVADYDGSYIYGCGTTIDHNNANYDRDNPLNLSIRPFTSTVGYYGIYGYGICDMAGNAWEWTSTVSGDFRVLCGGGWGGDGDCQIAQQDYYSPDSTSNDQGFRVVSDSDMQWVYVEDPGVDDTGDGIPDHEPFKGWISKYETTNAQYCEYLNAAYPSQIKVESGVVYAIDDSTNSEPYFETYPTDADSQITFNGNSFTVRSRDGYDMGTHPVVEVSWYGAKAFCSYYGYRLPTEWEWQAIADYDGSYTYGCGMTISCDKANYCPGGNYYDSCNPLGFSSDPFTTPVAYYPAYGYGICDMAGNVYEWTSNSYTGGGGFSGDEERNRVYYRSLHDPDFTHVNCGFRVVDIREYHVDGVTGDDGNDGLTRDTAFATIQHGIDTVEDGDTVLVWPGIYEEACDFVGKAITVTSAADAATVRNPGGYAFSFSNGEQADSVLSNLVLAGGMFGVYADTGCRPTLKNLTVADNDFGIDCHANADPAIVNCILANDTGDLNNCDAQHSWVQQDGGTGGLEAYYKLDGTTGAVVDETGNHNGTNNGATRGVPGMVGNAFEFDGDDYVSTDLIPSNYTTVSLWIYPTTTSSGGGILGTGYTTDGGKDGWAWAYYHDLRYIKLYFWKGNNHLDNYDIYTPNDSVPQEQWSFVTVVVNDTDISVYINGDLSVAGTLSGSPDVHDRGIMIGRHYQTGAGAHTMEGIIDEVAIYNRALSAEEVAALYNSSKGGYGYDDPMFADAAGGDYHLMSERGRYWDTHDLFVLDAATSPCVDAGDPNENPGLETSSPNGGRVNQGAYGNTDYASKSEWPLEHDSNRDGTVNMADYVSLAAKWMSSLPWVE